MSEKVNETIGEEQSAVFMPEHKGIRSAIIMFMKVHAEIEKRYTALLADDEQKRLSNTKTIEVGDNVICKVDITNKNGCLYKSARRNVGVVTTIIGDDISFYPHCTFKKDRIFFTSHIDNIIKLEGDRI